MIDDLDKIRVHFIVYGGGKCFNCNKYNEIPLHDYGEGTARELEKAMDEVLYPLLFLICSSCGHKYRPQKLLHRDRLKNNMIMIKTPIMNGNEIDEEDYLPRHKAHRERFEYFKDHEEEFWSEYEEFALSDWKAAIQELSLEELQQGYKKLNYPSPEKETAASYRKNILSKIKNDDDKRSFWKAVNYYFIYDHLLDLGPMGWYPIDDLKKFGEKRVRFAYLNFPMDECMEPLRTKYIGEVIRKEKGDNAFLFRRISQLTDELSRTQRKVTSYWEQLEKERAEKAILQEKLSETYKEIKKSKEEKNITLRDPEDIEKIQRLKSFINELKNEVKYLEARLPEEEIKQTEVILEEETGYTTQDEITNLSILEGKTIGIIGGKRTTQAKRDYPCSILTHPGKPFDPDYYNTLKKADFLIVITTHISHAAMWESKYYAIENDKPIIFERNINIPLLLQKAAEIYN